MGGSGQFVPAPTGPLLHCGVQVTPISPQTSPVAAGNPQHPTDDPGTETSRAGAAALQDLGVPHEATARTDPIFPGI